MKKEIKSSSVVFLVFALALILLITTFFLRILEIIFSPETSPPVTPVTPTKPFVETESIKKFLSEEDFKNYIKEGEAIFGVGFAGVMPPIAQRRGGIDLALPQPLSPVPLMGSDVVERVSETTVQVPGIDEPDIVKTDGKTIYFSPGKIFPIWREELFIERIAPPYPYRKPEIKIIKAFPPTELSQQSKIEKSGDLLLIKDKNILIVFSGNEILGYDVSNPKSPQKKWEAKLDNNNFIVAARLYNNKIYLVTKNTIDKIYPCPIKPIFVEGKEIEILCSEIYHPIKPLPVDVIFVAMVLNPLSGKIENKVSFVGSSGESVVYMSQNSIYVTYPLYENQTKVFFAFLKERCQDLIPQQFLKEIEKLESYDISQEAKSVEIFVILEKFFRTLDEDAVLKLENEMENRVAEYFKEKVRNIEKTGILKIELEGFEIKATGEVPGFPLNQFALDEYQKNLRIAVTVGERGWLFGFGLGRIESANDVYVLNEKLEILGSVQNLGLTERIYSTRFIEDKGYLVTFRQIDPFYVLDLKDPKNPQLKGELKIPGYSSYLHPITKDKILGIGKEGWQVKISLFDVSNPENPKEIDKYILDENWSDILNTHHAFLLDEKHTVFFLPGSKGGYVFSYKENKLSLIKAISQISAKRAIYIDDYLYIIGDNKVTVLDEKNWEKVKELEF